ncbi:MAG: hypothetical protein ACLVK5_00415 [Peptoniphilus senegalensis]
MKLKSEKYKNSEIVFGDKLISFDENGISIDLDDGIAKKLAILDFFELFEEAKGQKEVKEEPKEEVKETETKKRATRKTATK